MLLRDRGASPFVYAPKASRSLVGRWGGIKHR
jgi:hypothetical protein